MRQEEKMTYVRIDFQLFPGEIVWENPVIHETIPAQYEEVSLWLDENSIWFDEDEDIIEEGSLESDSGIFIRESQEHGFLWFPLPANVRSVSSASVPYALYEQSGHWMAHALPMMSCLVSCYPGVRKIQREAVDSVFRHSICMSGPHDTQEEAVNSLENELKFL
jgi:hypothetical protein